MTNFSMRWLWQDLLCTAHSPATKGRIPVEFYGRMGGMVPFPDEILAEIQRLTTARLAPDGAPRRSWIERFAPVIAAERK